MSSLKIFLNKIFFSPLLTVYVHQNPVCLSPRSEYFLSDFSKVPSAHNQTLINFQFTLYPLYLLHKHCRHIKNDVWCPDTHSFCTFAVSWGLLSSLHFCLQSCHVLWKLRFNNRPSEIDVLFGDIQTLL